MPVPVLPPPVAGNTATTLGVAANSSTTFTVGVPANESTVLTVGTAVAVRAAIGVLVFTNVRVVAVAVGVGVDVAAAGVCVAVLVAVLVGVGVFATAFLEVAAASKHLLVFSGLRGGATAQSFRLLCVLPMMWTRATRSP